MKKHTIYLILILFSLLISSCKYDYILPVVVVPVSNVSFATQVAPSFSTGNKCTACHKPGATSPDLTATNAYASIVPEFVNTTTPELSTIYVNASSGNHKATVTATQAALILQWIKEGAKNN